MKVSFDEHSCASVGMCESVAPLVFSIGKDGALHIDEAAASRSDRNLLEEAVESCPTGSLRLIE